MFKLTVSEKVSPVGHHSPQFMRLDDAKVGRLCAQNLQPGSHGRDELQWRVQQRRRRIWISTTLWRHQDVGDLGVGEADVVQDLPPHWDREVCRRSSDGHHQAAGERLQKRVDIGKLVVQVSQGLIEGVQGDHRLQGLWYDEISKYTLPSVASFHEVRKTENLEEN